MRPAVLIALACALLPAGVGVQRHAEPETAKTGTVSGRVVTESSPSQPVGRAVVTLRDDGSGDRITTTTADDGTFVFAAVPAGRYAVVAWKAAYLETAYGATRPGDSGVRVAVGDGDRAAVTIHMPFGAVVAGRVSDAEGNGMPGVAIGAYRLRLGAPPVVEAEVSETDDLGAFRIFGLPPGEYVIRANIPMLGAWTRLAQPGASDVEAMLGELAARSAGGPPAVRTPRRKGPAPSGPPVTYAPVYFPGVASADQAARLTLAAGEVREGLDFRFVPVHTSTIRGTVSGPVPDLGATAISLEPAGTELPALPIARTAHTSAAGAFEMRGVPPGRYTLRARLSLGGPTQPASGSHITTVRTPAAEAASTVGADLYYALTDVDVEGADTSGLALALLPGGVLSGRIAVEAVHAVPPNALRAIRVSVSPDAGPSAPLLVGSAFTTMREAGVRADGSFTITGIAPGTYTLRAGPVPVVGGAKLWLRSAQYHDRDLLDAGLHVEGGTVLTNVVVTFSARHTELAGTLSTSAGNPASGYAIVVFGVDPQSWRATSRRTRVVRPATDGAFSIRDLPPGDYWLSAVTDINADDLATGDFFRQVVPLALRVRIGEGRTTVQNLRIRAPAR